MLGVELCDRKVCVARYIIVVEKEERKWLIYMMLEI
nr:MAG TPA: hypothetical protein [Caudoviricetes sp.]